MIILYYCKLLTHQYHCHSTSHHLICNDTIANLYGTCYCKLTPKVPSYYLVFVPLPPHPSPDGVALTLLPDQNPMVPAFLIIAEGGVAALHIINMQ